MEESAIVKSCQDLSSYNKKKKHLMRKSTSKSLKMFLPKITAEIDACQTNVSNVNVKV